MIHQPLSESLVEVLTDTSPAAPVTPNFLLIRTEGRGLYLVIVLLALPFLTPIPIGLSLPFGLIIAALSFRLLPGTASVLPRWLGEREIPLRVRRLILGGGVRSLRWIEKWIRPRAEKALHGSSHVRDEEWIGQLFELRLEKAADGLRLAEAAVQQALRQ